MQPQGSAYNGDYIRALTSRLNTALSCQHLEELALEAVPSVQETLLTIAAAEAQVTALQALLKPPTDLPSMITWAGGIISLLVGPQVRPLIDLALQATQVSAELAALTSAIENAKVRFPQCQFTVPGL